MSHATTPHRAADDREDRQFAAQLADVRARVTHDLAAADRPGELVAEEFDRAAERFEQAQVRAFVPILVERAVRARFGQESAVAAEVG